MDQNTWEGVLQRVGNVQKPTSADPEQFLAHTDQYGNGVGSVSCDGLDGYRLYRSTDGQPLWQLAPDDSWSEVVYDRDAPTPPDSATYTAVGGATRTYVVSTRTTNLRDMYGVPLMRVAGELTLSPGAQVHTCLTDESDVQSVSDQLHADVVRTVLAVASWVPQYAIPVPTFSGSCATSAAVYTPWTDGPVVALGAIHLSDRATVAAGYTATASGSGVARWTRTGTGWSPPVIFASAVYSNGGSDTVPRLGISPDGSTVARCWLDGPVAGAGLGTLDDTHALGIATRYPEVLTSATPRLPTRRTGRLIPRAAGTSHSTGTAPRCGSPRPGRRPGGSPAARRRHRPHRLFCACPAPS